MSSNEFYQQSIPRNLVTAKGVVRCRFDLFIRWPDNANRQINPFTHRGDRYGITEPDKMLGSLLRYFIKDHHKWMLAELYDNIHPLNDCNRLILEWKDKKIKANLLYQYEGMLEQFPLPEWLKSASNK